MTVPCTHKDISKALDLQLGVGWDMAVKDVSLINFNGVVSITYYLLYVFSVFYCVIT